MIWNIHLIISRINFAPVYCSLNLVTKFVALGRSVKLTVATELEDKMFRS